MNDSPLRINIQRAGENESRIILPNGLVWDGPPWNEMVLMGVQCGEDESVEFVASGVVESLPEAIATVER